MKPGSIIRATAWVMLSLVLIVLLLLVLPISFGSRPSSSQLAITFVGVTNDLAGREVAVFSVSNLSGREIHFSPALPQVRVGEVWPKAVVGPPTPNVIRATRLGAGQLTNVFLAPPDSAGDWRVPIMWSARLNSLEFNYRRLKELLRKPLGTRSGWSSGISMDSYTNYSDTVSATSPDDPVDPRPAGF